MGFVDKFFTLKDRFNQIIGYYNPLKTGSYRIYEQDVDFDESDFSGWVGNPKILFRSPFSDSISDVSPTNPKQITIAFNETIKALQMGLGGSFSNIKVSLLGTNGTIRSIYDNSTDSTIKTSLNIQFEDELFNSVLIEFYTSNTISLSNITIQRSTYNTSQIQGMKPDGSFAVASLSGFSNLKVAIEEVVSDAFGRQKVSLPTSLLDSVIEHDMDNIFVDYLTSGVGATVVFDDVNNVVNMSVANDTEYTVIETIANGKYQPGKALEFVASTLMTTELNVIKRCGYCTVRLHNHVATNDIQNGVYFENNSGILSWNIVKNGVVTETSLKDDWNIDKLDGSGASGFTFNSDYVQLPYIDLQFLAVGTVRVGFNINGKDIIVHKFYHANTESFTTTYMHTANLPVHYSLTSLGDSGEMKAIGYSVASGGGFDALGKLNFVDVDNVSISSGVHELLIGIRLKDEYYNSFVKLLRKSVFSTGNTSDSKWFLLMNPTYTGSVTWTDEDGSAVQVATNNNNVVTDLGIKIDAGFMSDRVRSSTEDLDNSLRLAKKLDGSFLEIWLTVEAIDTDTYYGIINYKDLF